VLARLKLPRWPVLLLTSAAALVALNWVTDLPLTKTWDWGILRGISGFFLGALLHHLYVSAQPHVRGHNRTEQAFDALSIAAFLGAVAFLIWERDFGRTTMLILPLASGLVLGSALAPDGWMAKFLLLRPLRWLGAISYSIYMVHLFVIRMVLAALKVVFHMKTVDVDVSGQAVPTINSTVTVGILAALISVGVTLFVAHFMYRWVEVTWRSWSKTVLQRRSGAGTVGALGPLP
jgi:peptidoglycan/LPS O-acetylase OafA/YrhL